MVDMRPLARSSDHELLDGPRLDPGEIARNLREMAMLNRLPGGVDASVAAVHRLVERDGALPVLDIGTGAAQFARRLRRSTPVAIVAADVNHDVLEVARRTVAGMDRVTVVQADARAMPLPDGSVSVAHSSLLLHHLDPDDAVAAMREMHRVAASGVVVNDLRRSRLAWAMTAAPILAFARSPVTRHDGILSARRAYTLHELDDLAAQAGLQPVARTLVVVAARDDDVPMSTSTSDVLVVGAGPAGSAVAAALASSGRSVVLLDAVHHPRPKACAEYASPRIAEELARLGVPGGAWRADALPIGGMRVILGHDSVDIRYADARGRRPAGASIAPDSTPRWRSSPCRAAPCLRERTTFDDVTPHD